ncbi:hypothetical protein [Geobacter sp. OR-1]|uniref:hypothetical protein n=1 Tax=Geobacter sp. OR-1 TaxID=1266765 RepID=UPI001ED9A82F|nr:hypothetical protein [Geobacter sp. OR-1]
MGLRTGLALYEGTGRLVWYRSHNYGSTERLKQDVPRILESINGLTALVIEGGGNLANVWLKEAERRGKRVICIGAETWRPLFFYPREQKSGLAAKKYAGELARNVIIWSGAKKPTALRHDAAEAILIGLWGVIRMGWIQELPRELQRK